MRSEETGGRGRKEEAYRRLLLPSRVFVQTINVLEVGWVDKGIGNDGLMGLLVERLRLDHSLGAFVVQ